MSSYNEKYGTNLIYTNYPFLRINPNDSSSQIDTLYEPHPNAENEGYCYWLTNPVEVNTDYEWFVLHRRYEL